MACCLSGCLPACVAASWLADLPLLRVLYDNNDNDTVALATTGCDGYLFIGW